MAEGKSKRDLIWEMKKKQRENRNNPQGETEEHNYQNTVQPQQNDNTYNSGQVPNQGFGQVQPFGKENTTIGIGNGPNFPPSNGVFENYANSRGSNMRYNEQMGPPLRNDIPASRENFGGLKMNEMEAQTNAYRNDNRQQPSREQPRSLESLDFGGNQAYHNQGYRDNFTQKNNLAAGGFHSAQRQNSIDNLRQPMDQNNQQLAANDALLQQKMIEKQKKQEYGEFLRMQMQSSKNNQKPVEDRKAKFAAQMENPDHDFFGRRMGGGGGAPNRDTNGTIIATRAPRMDQNIRQQVAHQSLDYSPMGYPSTQNMPQNDMHIGRRGNENMGVGPSSGSVQSYGIQQNPYQSDQGRFQMPNQNNSPLLYPNQYNAPQPINPQENMYNPTNFRGLGVQNTQSHTDFQNNPQSNALPIGGRPYNQSHGSVGPLDERNNQKVINKRVTVDDPTPEEFSRKEKQKLEMQRALQEQIDAKKRLKEEQERERKREELEEEARLRREREKLEQEFEQEKKDKQKKAQIFENVNQEHVVSKNRKNANRKIIDDDFPPYNVPKLKNDFMPKENNQPIDDNPPESNGRQRRRPRPDLFENGAENTDNASNPKQDFQNKIKATSNYGLNQSALPNNNFPLNNNFSPAIVQTNQFQNGFAQEFVRANMNAEIHQIRSEIQNQQSILSKQLESIKNEAFNAMEERNRAEKELRDLREQLRHKMIQEDSYRDNLRRALEKNSEHKYKQLSEKMQTNNLPHYYEDRAALADKNAPGTYLKGGLDINPYSQNNARNFQILENNNSVLKPNDSPRKSSPRRGSGGGGGKGYEALGGSEFFGDVHNKTLIADTKMIPLDAFDQKNLAAHHLTMSKLNNFGIRPTSSRNTKGEADALDKLVNEADNNRPVSQNQERIAGVRAGINYYNMNHDTKWNDRNAPRPESDKGYDSYGMFVNSRAYGNGGDILNFAGKNALSGGIIFKEADMFNSGINLDNEIYSIPDDATGKFDAKNNSTTNFNTKSEMRNLHDFDIHKALETSTYSYGGGLASSFHIEKIHEANEARLKQLENVKFGIPASKVDARGASGTDNYNSRAQSRGNHNYLNVPMKPINEEDIDDFGKLDRMLDTYDGGQETSGRAQNTYSQRPNVLYGDADRDEELPSF